MTRTQAEFVEQDPLVKQLTEHHQQQHENLHKYKAGLLEQARRVSSLLLAFDCVVNKMFAVEDVEDEANQLEAVTGDDLETWLLAYNQAGDVVMRSVVDQCREVSLHDLKIKRLREEIKTTCKSLSTAREKALKRYDEMSKEAATANEYAD